MRGIGGLGSITEADSQFAVRETNVPQTHPRESATSAFLTAAKGLLSANSPKSRIGQEWSFASSA
jgi:hypothetical protein